MFDFIRQYASAIIAVCAIILTMVQAWITRRHNRLSVRPCLAQESHKSVSPQFGELTVRLVNKGIGPAIIDEFTVFLDGKPSEANEAVGNVLGDLKGTKTVSTMGLGSAISAGESKIILALQFPISSADDVEQVMAKVNKLDLRVTYRSMYKEKFTYTSCD